MLFYSRNAVVVVVNRLAIFLRMLLHPSIEYGRCVSPIKVLSARAYTHTPTPNRGVLMYILKIKERRHDNTDHPRIHTQKKGQRKKKERWATTTTVSCHSPVPPSPLQATLPKQLPMFSKQINRKSITIGGNWSERSCTAAMISTDRRPFRKGNKRSVFDFVRPWC